MDQHRFDLMRQFLENKGAGPEAFERLERMRQMAQERGAGPTIETRLAELEHVVDRLRDAVALNMEHPRVLLQLGFSGDEMGRWALFLGDIVALNEPGSVLAAFEARLPGRAARELFEIGLALYRDVESTASKRMIRAAVIGMGDAFTADPVLPDHE